MVVLALATYAWVAGRIFSKAHVELLEAEHDELAKANAATQAALQDVSRATTESLETSKTILRIVQATRAAHDAESSEEVLK